MGDRCINLKPWEAAAQPAASVIVKPVVPIPGWELQSITKSVPGGVMPCGPRVWWATCRKPEQGWTAADFIIDAPLAPGDRAILREAWRLFSNDGGIWIEYPVDGWCRELTAIEEEIVNDLQAWFRRTPQAMPAALARWRKPVVSVEAVEIDDVPHQTWCDAGFRRDPTLGGALTYTKAKARRTWLSTYGPGSWSGWCWVVTLGEVEP